MIYDSIDTIPSKLFFKILKTGDVNLLKDEEDIEESKLKEIWIKIQNEDDALSNNENHTKELNISKQIEALVAKMESINLSVYHLRIVKDDDLINHLKSYGYRFTDDLESDLNTIERETEGLLLKLKNYQRQLDKLNPNKDSKDNKIVPFDEVVLGYGVVTGLMFKTNEIKQSEYRALINVGNQKMKAIEASLSNGKR